ncbi:hypothetical protein B484DRAFT_430859 [Ochromonadaceae sp. CCMP2298]|nr:hypothetical protein B484DRAFT_431693 [Ochromonadaceae sp. CCMP2298]KAJ1429640.1 hypothetical protein B484DRAFT_430859 [Ochromonadaceae sp. CCMP2298]
MHASSHALLRLMALAFFALFAQARFPSSNIDLAVKRIEARLPDVQVPLTNSMPAQAESAPFLHTHERRLQDAKVVFYAGYLWVAAVAGADTCTATCSASGWTCSDAIQSAGADLIDETTNNDLVGQFTSPRISTPPYDVRDVGGYFFRPEEFRTATPFVVGKGSTFDESIYSNVKDVSTYDASATASFVPRGIFRLCACKAATSLAAGTADDSTGTGEVLEGTLTAAAAIVFVLLVLLLVWCVRYRGKGAERYEAIPSTEMKAAVPAGEDAIDLTDEDKVVVELV